MMSEEINPRDLSLTDLTLRCEQETKLYFRRQENDTRYCFELFRRAIQDGDGSVWGNIYPCYGALVSSWVNQHPGFAATGETVEYFVNGVFGKFSTTLTSERFQGFSDLGSVLRYLKLCVFSVIVDYNRQAEQGSLYSLDEAAEKATEEFSPEQQVMDRAVRQALWEKVGERLDNEKERLVMQGVFVWDMKPRELLDQLPTTFADVDEIYRIKQNILARLRRDPEIRKLLGMSD